MKIIGCKGNPKTDFVNISPWDQKACVPKMDIIRSLIMDKINHAIRRFTIDAKTEE